MYTYQFTLRANPMPTTFTWTRNGEVISTNEQVTVAVNSITIRNVMRNDSATYVVTSETAAGMATANFTLDVQCES